MMDNLQSNKSKAEARRNASMRMTAEKGEKAEAQETERTVEVESIAAEKVEAD